MLLVLRPSGDRWTGARAVVAGRWSARLWAVLGRLHEPASPTARSTTPPRRGGAADGRRRSTSGGHAVAPTDRAAAHRRGPGPRHHRPGPRVEPALGLARSTALGPDGLAAVLPFVQLTALTPRQRTLVRAAGVDLDELRDRAAALAGVEAPELQQLRRVTWRSVLQVGAAGRGVPGPGLGSRRASTSRTCGRSSATPTWWFVVVGFVLAQMPRLAQAVSTLGASPVAGCRSGRCTRCSWRRPTSAWPCRPARRASPSTSASSSATACRRARPLAVGALDGRRRLRRAGRPARRHPRAHAGLARARPRQRACRPASSAWWRSWWPSASAAHRRRAAGRAVVAAPRSSAGSRRLAAEAFGAARGLRSPRRLGMLFGGNLASEVLFAAALGAFARALGYLDRPDRAAADQHQRVAAGRACSRSPAASAWSRAA